MTDTVIKVENLSKRYLLGAQDSVPKTRKEAIANMMGAPFKYLRSMFGETPENQAFWALKDVSFEVKAGDVVGVIGRNGAGKSTLLKILSRITKPTSGHAEIRGRVGSLLEVGTGFHPELTGRENIYLNGAILGMRRWEIDKKFDEIVAFAEIERFLDTPVKRYSSGMYVRLAFAVAAHLEPEILIVDEVLAVGDAAFQKKCLGKMSDVATKEGRTVLFVSHNMSALSSLCRLGVFLEKGTLNKISQVSDCINSYLANNQNLDQNFWQGQEGNEILKLCEVLIYQESEQNTSFFTHKNTIIQIKYEISQKTIGLIIGIRIQSITGEVIAYSRIDDYILQEENYSTIGKHIKKLLIPANTFSEGKFILNIDIGIHNVKRIIDKNFTISFINSEGIGRKYLVNGQGFDNIFRLKWIWE